MAHSLTSLFNESIFSLTFLFTVSNQLDEGRPEDKAPSLLHFGYKGKFYLIKSYLSIFLSIYYNEQKNIKMKI